VFQQSEHCPLVLSQPQAAIKYLEDGTSRAIFQDLYLQALNLANLAEAHYGLQNLENYLYWLPGDVYLLNKLLEEWRQPAGLITILQGQMGDVAFQTLLKQYRSQIIAVIGVDV